MGWSVSGWVNGITALKYRQIRKSCQFGLLLIKKVAYLLLHIAHGFAAIQPAAYNQRNSSNSVRKP